MSQQEVVLNRKEIISPFVMRCIATKREEVQKIQWEEALAMCPCHPTYQNQELIFKLRQQKESTIGTILSLERDLYD